MHWADKEVCGTQRLRLPMRITLVAVIIMDWKKDGEQEQRGMQVKRLLQLSRGENGELGQRVAEKSLYVVVFQISFDD